MKIDVLDKGYIELVDKLLVGEAKRRQMELGAWFVNVAAPVSEL